MLNRINNFMNIVIGSFFGTSIGFAMYKAIDYNINPNRYYITSFPWYTSVLIYAAFSAVVIAVSLAIKFGIKLRIKKQEQLKR